MTRSRRNAIVGNSRTVQAMSVMSMQSMSSRARQAGLTLERAAPPHGLSQAPRSGSRASGASRASTLFRALRTRAGRHHAPRPEPWRPSRGYLGAPSAGRRALGVPARACAPPPPSRAPVSGKGERPRPWPALGAPTCAPPPRRALLGAPIAGQGRGRSPVPQTGALDGGGGAHGGVGVGDGDGLRPQATRRARRPAAPRRSAGTSPAASNGPAARLAAATGPVAPTSGCTGRTGRRRMRHANSTKPGGGAVGGRPSPHQGAA